MPLAYVYVLSFNRTGLFYIGSTSNVDKRINRHCDELRRNVHHNKILQSNFQIEDLDDLLINVFELPDLESAFKFEEDFIKQASTGLFKSKLANIGLNARAGDNLSMHPNRVQILQQRTKTQRDNIDKLEPEERKRIWGRVGELNGMYGKRHSDDAKKKISDHHKGHSFNKGCKLSPQHIEQIRARGRLAIGPKNPFFGKKHSEDTLRRLREATLEYNKLHPKESKKISGDGTIYNSAKEAALKLNVSHSLITWRARNDKIPNWFYVNETDNV